MAKRPPKFQASQYDKVLKENIEAALPSLIQNVLGINVVSWEELPDDLQHTKERKPDVLKKITDTDGNAFVLQIEFQVSDEPEMVYRMAEYHIMLERKYKIPVEQFVIFLGPSKPKMPTWLNSRRMRFEFPLINFLEIDYRIFLNSTKPEEIILGILADFKQDRSEKALVQIIQRIEETTSGDFALKRYFRQLRILAQLRNLDLKLTETMDSIAQYMDITRDIGYKYGLLKGEKEGMEKGMEKGINKGKEPVVRNLLTQTDFTVEQIASLAEVSIDFVKKIQDSLSSEN